MNKQKVTIGIVTMVIGLLMINTSSIDAIIDSSSQLYMEIESHDIDLSKKSDAIVFNTEEKKKASFWLVQPNRDIESKDFKIVISILDENKKFVKGFRRDFAFKTTRQEIDGKYHYKLGDHKFSYDFDGFIKYELEGDWLPETTPALSFKENRKTSFSQNQVLVSLSGAILLVLGFVVLVRNTSEQGEAIAKA